MPPIKEITRVHRDAKDCGTRCLCFVCGQMDSDGADCLAYFRRVPMDTEAARQCGRKAIGIERDPRYVALGASMLAQHTFSRRLPMDTTLPTQDQLDFAFPLDKSKLTEFLSKYLAIENEQDRLREELRLLKDDFADALPLRGLLVAVKIVRARLKLENHPKEPMPREHLEYLQTLVEQHLSAEQQALDALTADITTGELHGESVAFAEMPLTANAEEDWNRSHE